MTRQLCSNETTVKQFSIENESYKKVINEMGPRYGRRWPKILDVIRNIALTSPMFDEFYLTYALTHIRPRTGS